MICGGTGNGQDRHHAESRPTPSKLRYSSHAVASEKVSGGNQVSVETGENHKKNIFKLFEFFSKKCNTLERLDSIGMQICKLKFKKL